MEKELGKRAQTLNQTHTKAIISWTINMVMVNFDGQAVTFTKETI